ncbi:MAG: PAS domain S-box protein [Gemmatimonadota bacterium]
MLDLSYSVGPVPFYLASSVLIIGLGAGILLFERFASSSRRFFVLALTIAAWMVPLGLTHAATTADAERLWLRIAYLAIPLTIPSLYWLARSLATGRSRAPELVVWGVGGLFAASNAAGPWLVDGLRALLAGSLQGLAWLGAVYLAAELVGIVLTVQALVASRRGAMSGAERREKAMLVLGAAVGALTFLDYVLAHDPFRAGYLTPPALLVAMAIVAYVAARYRIFAPGHSFAIEEVFQTMADAVLVCDGVGQVRGSNPAARRLLGRSETQLFGTPVGRVVGWLRTDGEWEEWTPSAGVAGTEELDLRNIWGDAIRVSASVETIRIGSRNAGTVIVARDIRERLKTERELQVQRRYFADLFESSPEGIVLLEAETGVILRVNREFTHMFGYTRDEAVGEHLDSLIVPEDRAREAEELNRSAREGRRVRTETVRRRKDGSLVEVSVLARELRIPGEPAQLYGVYRDITDRKETERALQEREEELRHAQKLEAVGKLAGGVAHDFNNLLTVINGHARFALENVEAGNRLRDDLLAIEKSGARAAQLTQQLLAFSRRQVLHPQVLDPNDVVRGIQGMLRRLIGEHIRVQIRLTDREVRVRADRGQLEQVLINLVVNARDAMPSGGTLTLETDVITLEPHDDRVARWDVEPGSFVRLRVADTGVGMDPETLEQAFEPFFTTKEPGKGTGLGLATVFGIVKQSGGHVRARSAPGAGTVCEVILPRSERPVSTGERSGAMEGPEDRPDGTVLVVEDEDAVRKLTVRVLERAGFTVLAAENGARALDVMEAHDGVVDVVLTDMVMPEMGGRELAWHIRRRRPGIPIIFMSGYDDALVAEAETGEESEFLAKPFTPATLARRITEAISPQPAG